MSASTERKNRQAARAAGTDKKQIAAREAAEKARKTRRKWIIGTSIVALCILLILFFSSSLFYRVISAETIGSRTFSAAQVNSFKPIMNYEAYSYYMGAENARTYLDNNLVDISARLDYAEEQGLRLTSAEKDQAKVMANNKLAQIEEYAAQSGADASTFISHYYGAGVSAGMIRSCYEDMFLAQKAVFHKFCQLQYTPADLEAYCAEHPEETELCSYAFYLLPVDGTHTAVEAKAAADDLAESTRLCMEDAPNALSALQDALAELLPDAMPSLRTNVSLLTAEPDLRDWLAEEGRAAGDVTSLEASDGSGSYVVLFLNRSDTQTVAAVRHILVRAEAAEDGSISDEAKDAARQRAEELLAAWEAGDKTEADFALLAALFSDDSATGSEGGLYSTVVPGQTVEEFDAFCFAEGRQYGDTAIVYGESEDYAGYHILFYVEKLPGRHAFARDALRSEAMDKWVEDITNGLSPEYHWGNRLVK
jgi:parvulin-like peptidyl-prolyl isomerase